jgi:hypothetical protein
MLISKLQRVKLEIMPVLSLAIGFLKVANILKSEFAALEHLELRRIFEG